MAHGRRAFEVDELAVRPDARRQSLGRRLLAAIVEQGPGRAGVAVDAAVGDRDRRLHRRVGWIEVPAPAGTDESLVVFTRPPAVGGG